VGYHNHSHEFHQYDGQYALDIFFSHADGVVAELDLGWVLHAGVDPVAYMQKYSGRVPTVHIKDFKAEGGQTEIGTGTLPLAAIVAAAPAAGVQWHVIEIEEYSMAPLESVKVSLDNLRALL
jgi:sugar phosphate isomerase/epimerase